MKHFYLIWNPLKTGTEVMAEQIREYLEARGCTCAVRRPGGAQVQAGRPSARLVSSASAQSPDPSQPPQPAALEQPSEPSQVLQPAVHGRPSARLASSASVQSPDPSQPPQPATLGQPSEPSQPASSSVPAQPSAPSSPAPRSVHTDASLVPADTECVITLGGDGTLIRAARDLSGRRLPMIGVNMGHLGYLTQVGCEKPDEVRQMLDDLIAGRFQLERRMMLKGTVRRGGRILKDDLALNEILISRREMPKILHLKLSVNGAPLCHYEADGMIIATPTGSTAYNLSAGGPIVAPSAQMMILTPICPHGLNVRSIVLPAEDIIEIGIMGNDDEGQAVVFDGGAAVRLKVGDTLRAERSQVETVMIKLREVSFVDNLRAKMAER